MTASAGATVTLSQTTLARGCIVSDREVQVVSATGLTPGIRLYVNRELMSVVSLGVVGNLGTWVQVKRGVDGTSTTAHNSGETVVVGRADQFFQQDPQGHAPSVALVSPYINVVTGDWWITQGDAAAGVGGSGVRWWAKQTNIHSIGSGGVRTNTVVPNTASPATTTQS